MIELLFCSKYFRRGLVAHLDEILHGKIGKRIGILFSPNEVFGEGALAVVREFGQTFIKHHAIFEGGVHTLAVEWDDSMRGVADKRDLVFVAPWRAANRHKRSGRIFAEILQQRRHKRDGIWKFVVEKATDIVVSLGRGETARTFEFPEERTGK